MTRLRWFRAVVVSAASVVVAAAVVALPPAGPAAADSGGSPVSVTWSGNGDPNSSCGTWDTETPSGGSGPYAISVQLSGAGGGVGGKDLPPPVDYWAVAGTGGLVSTTVEVDGPVSVYLGCGGQNNVAEAGGSGFGPGGGAGQDLAEGGGYNGGNGGGASVLCLGVVTSGTQCAEPLVIGGGGGGGAAGESCAFDEGVGGNGGNGTSGSQDSITDSNWAVSDGQPGTDGTDVPDPPDPVEAIGALSGDGGGGGTSTDGGSGGPGYSQDGSAGADAAFPDGSSGGGGGNGAEGASESNGAGGAGGGGGYTGGGGGGGDSCEFTGFAAAGGGGGGGSSGVNLEYSSDDVSWSTGAPGADQTSTDDCYDGGDTSGGGCPGYVSLSWTALGGTPVIYGINPGSGPITGGTDVTITGENLTGVDDVRFDNVSANIISPSSPTSVEVQAPALPSQDWGDNSALIFVSTPYAYGISPVSFVFLPEVPVQWNGGSGCEGYSTTTVPPNADALSVTLSGAGGGTHYGAGGPDGGNGGSVDAVLTDIAGQTLSSTLGCPGGSSSSSGPNFAQGGQGAASGGNSTLSNLQAGGGGGGASALCLGSGACTTPVLVAAGGGGGGWASQCTQSYQGTGGAGGNGGAGSTTTTADGIIAGGQDGTAGVNESPDPAQPGGSGGGGGGSAGGSGGAGGEATAAEAGGNGADPFPGNGGTAGGGDNVDVGGAGGGGGWAGGGAGGGTVCSAGDDASGGGGGGSSYANPDYTEAGTTTFGTGGLGAVGTTESGAGGGSLSNGDTWSLTPPTITSVWPDVGPITGGTPVTVTGTNLDPVGSVSWATVLSATPTQIVARMNPGPAFPSPVSITVATDAGTAVLANAFTYTGGPAVTTSSLPSGAVGTPYAATLQATAGEPPYTWSLASGSLPSGVTLDPSSGQLSGTPNESGAFRPQFEVTDSFGLTGLSNGLPVTIASTATTTTVSYSPTDVTYGDPVTYSAQVAPVNGSSVPTGTVVFSVGSTTLCSSTVASTGTAQCSADLAPGGNDLTVTGSYQGDANDEASSASQSGLVVQTAASETSVEPIPNPTSFGSSVAYDVEVTSTASGGDRAAPTGTVAITIGDASVCTATVTDGTGSCASDSAPTGTGVLVNGAYSGDGNFAPSSGGASLTVTPAQPSVSLVVQPSTVSYGSYVTYSAQVQGVSNAVPTGTVDLYDGTGAFLCEGTLAAGSGSCQSDTSAVGAGQTITATYNGDGNYGAAQGSATLSVGPEVPLVTPLATPATTNYGQSVTFSASVVGGPSTLDAATGTVAFSSGGDNLCTATLGGSGQGSCTAVPTSAGFQALVATYSGDGNYTGATGGAHFDVIPQSSTTALGATPRWPSYGTTVTYRAVVTAPWVPPTGTVTVSAGSLVLCSGPVSAGVASCQATTTPTGTKMTVSALYNGDNGTDDSTGTTTVTVTAAPTTTTVEAVPSGGPFGTPVVYSARVTAAGGAPTGTVTFRAGIVPGHLRLLCSAPVEAGGTSSCTSAGAPVGSEQVKAAFAGRPDYKWSEATTQVTVTPATVEVGVTVTPSTLTYGATARYRATLASPVAGGGVRSGSVQFAIGSSIVCTARVVAGAASCRSALAPPGTDETVTATFGGSADYLPGSGTATLTVDPVVATTRASARPSTVTS